MKFDPTYAPPGYRAVESDGDCCHLCAFQNSNKCYEYYCLSTNRPDEHYAYFVKVTAFDSNLATVGMGERSFAEWPITKRITIDECRKE